MSLMNSPTDREDHLRLLLDQRAARADLHGRFPSLSEFSDSPSIYSRAHFSPRPVDRAQLDANFELVVPPQARTYPPEPRSPKSVISDRERLNFPNASSLDLDDDPRSSYAYSNSHEDDDASPVEDEEELPRISTYGPKMTVHSRAPWELDESDEQEGSGSSKRSKHRKVDGAKRVWGLSKGNNEKRPSTESTRSQGKGKQSLEFSNNGGALMALAQASMSSTSLALVSSPQPTLRDKLSLSRLRSRTPSNPNPSSTLEPIDTRHPPFPMPSGNTSPMSRLMRSASPAPLSPLDGSYSDSASRASTPSTPHHEYTHPYANPDLVRRAYEPPEVVQSPKQSLSTVLPGPSVVVNRSDSNATLTDTTTTSSMFQSRSNTTVSSLTPVTSLSSMNPSINDYSPTRVQGKGISAPVSVSKGGMGSLPPSPHCGVFAGATGSEEKSPKTRSRDTKLPSSSAAEAFPGWNEGPVTPSIKLISLEEAQAQARERSRSATHNPAISSAFGAGPSRTQAGSVDQEPQAPFTSTRARSSSAGGVKPKMDSTQRPPIPTDAPYGPGVNPPARLVTRKKSGFMRLFNAKERDRALYSPPPPVPSLSSNTMTTVSSQSSSHPPRARKASTTHRVPVPSLSPSLVGDFSIGNADSGSSSDTRSDASGSKESVVARERQLSARRNTPGLSIVTSASMINTSKLQPPSLSAASENSPSHGHIVTITPTASDSFSSAVSDLPPHQPPNSAPPGSSDFVALSLRPVSTLFSTTFAEQLRSPSGLSRPSLDIDHGTPTTATTAISPLSPDFPLKSYSGVSDDKISPIIAQDDQSSVIQALQDQIMVARRAWQRQIWELEGQVRDLKSEVEELRAAENGAPYCSACGRGNLGRPNADNDCIEDLRKVGVKVGVVNRPRARTGVGSRFASGT